MIMVFVASMLIFGTVVGSGFLSGNEMVVFFSRFGVMSYVYIALASILMFFAFYYFLSRGKRVADYIQNNKYLNFLILAISIVFCASMFAGIKNLFGYFEGGVYYFLVVLLLLLSVFVTAKGIGGLERANAVLTPIFSVIFLFVIVFSLGKGDGALGGNFSWAGMIYAPLYVSLNVSMSVFVLAKMGEKLNKKQTLFASLFSSFLLFGFLILCNIILQKNPNSFSGEMPILDILKDNKILFILEYFVILIGCFTTLFSLLFTINNTLKNYIKNNLFCIFLSVFLPFIISSIGFSEIISFLYPICSIFGIIIILFSVFSLEKADKIIHPKSKHTQNGS